MPSRKQSKANSKIDWKLVFASVGAVLTIIGDRIYTLIRPGSVMSINDKQEYLRELEAQTSEMETRASQAELEQKLIERQRKARNRIKNTRTGGHRGRYILIITVAVVICIIILVRAC